MEKKLTESQLVNTIIEELLFRKIMVWRTNNTPIFDAKRGIYRSMPKFSRHGVPDISGVLAGRALFIEVKLPRGRLSPHQERFMAEASEQGAIVILARSMRDVLEHEGFKKYAQFV